MEATRFTSVSVSEGRVESFLGQSQSFNKSQSFFGTTVRTAVLRARDEVNDWYLFFSRMFVPHLRETLSRRLLLG